MGRTGANNIHIALDTRIRIWIIVKSATILISKTRGQPVMTLLIVFHALQTCFPLPYSVSSDPTFSCSYAAAAIHPLGILSSPETIRCDLRFRRKARVVARRVVADVLGGGGRLARGNGGGVVSGATVWYGRSSLSGPGGDASGGGGDGGGGGSGGGGAGPPDVVALRMCSHTRTGHAWQPGLPAGPGRSGGCRQVR